MQLHKTTDASEGTTLLQQTITKHLQHDQKVLWLVPGGSNIPISVAVMSSIPTEVTPYLTVALTDERYGDFNHPDSNWYQLDKAGFDVKQATKTAVLQPNASLAESTTTYDNAVSTLLASHDVIIGQFGMGRDGHIAGILPHSMAATSTGNVVSYETATFTRITATFTTIKACHAAFLFAFGDDKQQALKNLTTDMPLTEQPAQILKQIRECHVYNDQIGETS